MLNEDVVYQKLVHILREHVQYTGEIGPSMQLRTDMGLDSLQQLTFVVEVENAFSLCLAPQAEADLTSLQDVVNYVQTHKELNSDQQPQGDGAMR